MSQSIQTRFLWTQRLVALGFLAGILLSWKLWISERLYPLFPVWEWVPFLPHPWDKGLFGCFCLSLIALLIRPNWKSMAAVLAFLLILILQDQSRWQPWVYQYLLMIGGCILVMGNGDKAHAIVLLRLVVIMVYFWGGIHKCQPGWMSVWETSLVAPFIDDMKDSLLRTVIVGFGYVVPPVEILMGLGLVFRKTRPVAIGAVILTHVTILFLLGPSKGTISNSVVWPWNLVMVSLVLVLFLKVGRINWSELPKLRLLLPVMVVVPLLTVAPLLFYAGIWDRYLSFSLYAGQQKQYLVRIDRDDLETLPRALKAYLVDPKARDGHKILNPSRWSNDELNVPLVSEWRILRAFSQKLCRGEYGAIDPVFYIDYRHLPEKSKRLYECNQIEEMREPSGFFSGI